MKKILGFIVSYLSIIVFYLLHTGYTSYVSIEDFIATLQLGTLIAIPFILLYIVPIVAISHFIVIKIKKNKALLKLGIYFILTIVFCFIYHSLFVNLFGENYQRSFAYGYPLACVIGYWLGSNIFTPLNTIKKTK